MKCQRLSNSENKHWFLMALETEKSEIKVLADLVPNERLPLPTLCPHTERSGGGGLWPLPLLGRMLIPLWGFALRTSSNTNDLPKAPPPETNSPRASA